MVELNFQLDVETVAAFTENGLLYSSSNVSSCGDFFMGELYTVTLA